MGRHNKGSTSSKPADQSDRGTSPAKKPQRCDGRFSLAYCEASEEIEPWDFGNGKVMHFCPRHMLERESYRPASAEAVREVARKATAAVSAAQIPRMKAPPPDPEDHRQRLAAERELRRISGNLPTPEPGSNG